MKLDPETLGVRLPADLELDRDLLERHVAGTSDHRMFPPPRTWAVFVDGEYAILAAWRGGPDVEFSLAASADPFAGLERLMMVSTLLNPHIEALTGSTPPRLHARALNHLFVVRLGDLFWADHSAYAVPVICPD